MRLVLALLLAALPATASAWGASGHRMVGELAAQALPEELPAFLRAAATEVGELSREPDRWRNAGRTHDQDRDPAHFLDVDDAGLVLGGPPLGALPATRGEYETTLRAAGTDSWKAGYLYYAVIDGWQQLAKDFAYWRALTAAEGREADPARRAWLAADRARREALILRDLGTLGHYVGDGAQPLHISIHHNGWTGENPDGYTTSKIHLAFEGAFVAAHVGPDAVRARMAAPADCACPIDVRTSRLLQATFATTRPFYALEKTGAFAGPDPRGVAFAAERLAAGASELRDMTLAAWRAAARGSVGWPILWVGDIEAGKVDPYDSLRGMD